MKVAIVGSRGITRYDLLTELMDEITRKYKVTQIVSGGAAGVDRMAERWAKEHNTEMLVIPADWEQYGKRAGFLRNEEIVKSANMVLALWDGVSKGTASTIEMAKKAHKLKEVVLVK